jgi:hypothetical protein
LLLFYEVGERFFELEVGAGVEGVLLMGGGRGIYFSD